MPWTLVHPAAVLPIRRLGLVRFSFGGLLVGSISPDIGYYVGRFDLAAIAHTTFGLLILCLPTGLVLFALVRLLHWPVAYLLPEPHRMALLSVPAVPNLPSLRIMLVVTVSIIIGAMTHNAWDSFTHPAGYMVTRVPLLRESIVVFGSRRFRIYEILQHVSTLVGLMVVVVVYLRWLKGVRVAPVDRVVASDRWRYALLFALAAVSVIVGALVTHEMFGKANGAVMIVRFVIATTSLFVVALCLIALWVSRRQQN